MLGKEAVIVLQHYLPQGLSKTAIARKLGVTRRTVQRYAKSGKTEAQSQQVSRQAVSSTGRDVSRRANRGRVPAPGTRELPMPALPDRTPAPGS
jgi:transposase